jgi:hypothetical protein
MQEDLPSHTRQTDSAKATLCVKCEHLCDLHLERCDRCGAHLFVLCSGCGHKNPRVISRCEKCQHRLHKTVKDRVRRTGSGRFNLLYFGAAILVIVVAAVLVIWLADIPFPRLW